MNLKSKLKKLQTALVKSGVIVKINQTQFYSADQQRMITQYHVILPTEEYNEEKEKNIVKNTEILKTCSVPEVINCLLSMYRQVNSA